MDGGVNGEDMDTCEFTDVITANCFDDVPRGAAPAPVCESPHLSNIYVIYLTFHFINIGSELFEKKS